MTDRRIIKVLVLICFLFLCLIGYLTYMEFAMSEKLSQSPYNQRQWAYEEDVERGSVFDNDGKVLAYSENGKRVYPYNNMYSHIIGYNSQTYGKSQLESNYNKVLLGQYGLGELNLIGGKKKGYDIYLTIDHDLQTLAYNSLGGRNGAVVAINPKTGKILAMASRPDFNPNPDILTKEWEKLIENEKSPLLARATGGLYAPGSTFKILTASAALDIGLENNYFEDTGEVTIGGKTVKNSGGHAYGKIDFDEAFKLSSNVAFCTMGAEIGFGKLKNTAEDFGFNKQPDYDFSATKSIFPDSSDGDAVNAALAMGQGETLATPLQMALVGCAIANDGVIMKPYIVDRAVNSKGLNVLTNKPQKETAALSYNNAQRIKEMMVETVKSGTGTAAQIWGIDVAGKTGTAENEETVLGKAKEHTWFVGFAPADDPQIAVCVMLEYSGGSGGGNCGPIARKIINQYLR